MNKLLLCKTAIVLASIFTSCHGQEKEAAFIKNNKAIVGGGCDGCELMYKGVPENISSTSISPGWNEPGQRLIVTGTVYQLDGKTTASNVIVYYWQTDNNGHYSSSTEIDEGAKRHGHIRGWVKTDRSGKYTIKTIRPAPYPNQTMPAHIHLSVKEPDIANEYYTDEINFDDDKYLIGHFKKYPQENRGGSGVVRVLIKDSFQIAEHNLILGLNIPNYPKKQHAEKQSGLSIGEDQPSFTPYHAYGPDKGTQTCPVCKYGRYHGIIYFVGNKPDWIQIKKWLRFLEQESIKRQKYLKVYFVYGNERSYNYEERRKLLEQLGRELTIQNTALTFVPSFSDKETEVHLNKIDPDARNMFIIFKRGNIVSKHVDLASSIDNFRMIESDLDRTRGEYFNLSEPLHE